MWIRAIVFSLLVPGMLGGYVPLLIGGGIPAPGFWATGWLLVMAGLALYALCALGFLRAQGTPAIFFTRHLRGLWGEEPHSLVRTGVYRYSRNPMYVAVLSAIFGQALLFASARVAFYGLVMFAFFHGIVTGVEEPHLRARDPHLFLDYCEKVRLVLAELFL